MAVADRAAPRAETADPGPCNVVEYDGAFKCLAHGRVWGAITNPDEPCPRAAPEESTTTRGVDREDSA